MIGPTFSANLLPHHEWPEPPHTVFAIFADANGRLAVGQGPISGSYGDSPVDTATRSEPHPTIKRIAREAQGWPLRAGTRRVRDEPPSRYNAVPRRRYRSASPPMPASTAIAMSMPAPESAGAGARGSGEHTPALPGLSHDSPAGQAGSAQQTSSTQLPETQSSRSSQAPPSGTLVAVVVRVEVTVRVALGVIVALPVLVTVGLTVGVIVTAASSSRWRSQ